MSQDLKTCWVCKVPKTLDLFHRDRTKADGRQARCAACTKGLNASRYAANKTESNEASRARYAAIGKHDNAARYQRYRDAYLQRRTAELETVRGRLYSVFAAARDRAQKNDLECLITLDWLMLRWVEIRGCCEVSGLPLTLDRDLTGRRFYAPLNPSLDRRDNDKGYTPENTRIVCVLVNLGLNRFGDEAFIRVCRAVAARNP